MSSFVCAVVFWVICPCCPPHDWPANSDGIYHFKDICLASLKAKWSCANSINTDKRTHGMVNCLTLIASFFQWHTVQNQLPILGSVFDWLGFPAALVQRWTWNSLSCTTAQLLEQYEIAWDDMYSMNINPHHAAIIWGNLSVALEHITCRCSDSLYYDKLRNTM